MKISDTLPCGMQLIYNTKSETFELSGAAELAMADIARLHDLADKFVKMASQFSKTTDAEFLDRYTYFDEFRRVPACHDDGRTMSKLDLIKTYRQETGSGLKESKDFIEDNIVFPEGAW